MTGDDSADVVTQATRGGDRPHRWDDLAEQDRENIRRFLRRRREEGAGDDELHHDLSVLVGLATMEANGPLSSARLGDFEEPTDRPGRALAHFLVFIGQETTECPECGARGHRPAEEEPGWMACEECGFTVDREGIAYRAYSEKYGG